MTTVEDLYQAIKTRLMAELVASIGPAGGGRLVDKLERK